MRYQAPNFKDTSFVQLKYDIDGTVEKTTLTVYEDSSDEAFLEMIEEFQNYIKNYETWNDESATHTVYRNFQRFLVGAARNLQGIYGIK